MRYWLIVSRTETPSERGGSRAASCLEGLRGILVAHAASIERRATEVCMIEGVREQQGKTLYSFQKEAKQATGSRENWQELDDRNLKAGDIALLYTPDIPAKGSFGILIDIPD